MQKPRSRVHYYTLRHIQKETEKNKNDPTRELQGVNLDNFLELNLCISEDILIASFKYTFKSGVPRTTPKEQQLQEKETASEPSGKL